MAGIYIHIPFCKRRCRYCDFYSTTLSSYTEAYVSAACREMEERSDFFRADDSIETLYIGGGTPSQLSPTQIATLIHTAADVYGFTTLKELTIEANPDDVTDNWADGVIQAASPYSSPRISMGVQTFDDQLLKLIGRRHTAHQAIDAVNLLKGKGIGEISIDLMYGLPGGTTACWQRDLDTAIRLKVPHISAYHLIYEEGTPLWQMKQRGEVNEADEDDSVAFFRMVRKTLIDAGYEHYEISNFALPGHHAIHNSSYWDSVPYIGIGPGAHSFDGIRRSWNQPDLIGYLKGNRGSESELLTDDERYDEYIMTRLRTARGISLSEIEALFGPEKRRYCALRAQTYLKSHRLHETSNGRMAFTEEGIFVSDGIITDLFSE